eukprot:200264-Prorocentrum_lima.AAC.1
MLKLHLLRSWQTAKMKGVEGKLVGSSPLANKADTQTNTKALSIQIGILPGSKGGTAKDI